MIQKAAIIISIVFRTRYFFLIGSRTGQQLRGLFVPIPKDQTSSAISPAVSGRGIKNIIKGNELSPEQSCEQFF
jgi:hypothetical protein